jgi:dipeptidyl aminopeptidase/acylaminoacyl peptidase
MKKDIRESALYQETVAFYKTIRQVGSGLLSDAAEVHVSPDGKSAVYAGVLVNNLDGVLPTRICQVDLVSGDNRVLTFGPQLDRLPKYSPDGRHIAFLSDRNQAGNFQLYLLDPVTGAAHCAPPVEGWVEYLHWSPDGRRILLGVAGHGADLSGGQGAITSRQFATDAVSWMPSVETGNEDYHWRRVWVYELGAQSVRQVGPTSSNVWEAVWCGNESLAAVVSPGPGEGLWYSARAHIIDIASGGIREIYTPSDQIGWPAASPSGSYLAIVDAVCSDRWIVAGDLRIVETSNGTVQRVDTNGVDITHAEWRSDQRLLLAGHRGFETVVALYDAGASTFREIWCSRDVTTGGRYITVSGSDDAGNCVLVGESFTRAPEIAAIDGGLYRTVKSFDIGYAKQAAAIGSVEQIQWSAPNGLEIQGWLLRPAGPSPHAMVMNIHGGPVWQWRPTWLARPRTAPILMLVKHGYAVFLPNPRGSSGRGQEFARHVVGEMGGADTYDCLSGIDYLVARGLVDPSRLGVMGISYGGFMTAWLITQDSRFRAAVPVAPMTNHVTEYLISNISEFMTVFLADHYANPGGKFFQRSPIMHADKVKTPTLSICGALDRCTPPEEAAQFHNALLQNGATSVLVKYPEEGHGIHKLPAAIDYAARVVAWFEDYIPVMGREH